MDAFDRGKRESGKEMYVCKSKVMESKRARDQGIDLLEVNVCKSKVMEFKWAKRQVIDLLEVNL